MKEKSNLGYLYALCAAMALSASFIFSKSALNHVSMIQFGVVWFTFGLIWNSIWYFGRGLHKSFKHQRRQRLSVAFLVAFLEGAGTGLFYLAIKAMENPAVVSFIGNIGPVFVTFLGVVFLRERFKPLQIVGIVITIAGIFVINFRNGAFIGFLDPGAKYVILASFIFSLATISGRFFKQFLDPDFMSLIRVFMLTLVFIILFLISGEPLQFESFVWRDLAIGSLFETLLTILFAYQALRKIEATSTSLIISSKGVWTLLLAWVFLDVFPSGIQLIGGVMTMLGIYFITWKAMRK